MTATQNPGPLDEDPVRVHVASTDLLTPELITRVETACGDAEDRGRGAIVLWLRGGEDPRPADDRPLWPGPVTVSRVNRWERVVRRLERAPVPTLAVAEANCRGAAIELLLASDYRLVAGDLQLRLGPPGQAPWPSMALFRLTNAVGVGRARRAVLFGAPLSAPQALECGLVDETFVNGGDELLARVAEIAADLSALPGAEVAIRRRLLHEANVTRFEDAFGGHLAACDRALRRTAGACPSDSLPSDPLLVQV